MDWISSPNFQQFNFGERGVVALFRGAGGLLGSSNSSDSDRTSGIDSLNERLTSQFQDYFWSSQVFDSYRGNIFGFTEIGSQQAHTWISQLDTIGRIGGIGYSAGGLSVTRFSKQQATGIVDLQIQIESFDPLTGNSSEDEILPANVLKGINYYQERNRFNVFAPGFDPTDLQGAETVQGAENINVEDLLDDRSITHRNIINQPELQEQIAQDVETFVLNDLRFDRQGLINLEGNAASVNNLLRLTSSTPSAGGQAALANAIEISPDFSFSTRFEFRLTPELPDSGFAFDIQSSFPTTPSASLSLIFDPLLSPNQPANVVRLQRSSSTIEWLSQVNTTLDLDSGNPLTAWIHYDGPTDQLDVFLSNTLIRPATPLLSYDVDLFATVGSEAVFEFQTTAGQAAADILSWQLTTLAPGDATIDPTASVTDFNSDGVIDLLWRNQATGQNWIWNTNGQTRTSGRQLNSVNDLNWTIGGIGDFDQNRDRNDILWRNQETGENAIWLVTNNQKIGELPVSSFDPTWEIEGVGDFEHTGHANDIIWRNADTGQVLVWMMNGNTKAGEIDFGTVETTWQIQAAGSFDSSGYADDFVWQNQVDGRIVIWQTNGLFKTAQKRIGTVATNWAVKGVSDFDRDGQIDDLLFRDRTSGTITTWYMENLSRVGTQAFSPTVSDLNSPDSFWESAKKTIHRVECECT